MVGVTGFVPPIFYPFLIVKKSTIYESHRVTISVGAGGVVSRRGIEGAGV